MSSKQASIDILTIHRENLLKTETFEQYRDAHCAYIDMLIEQYEADLAKEHSITVYTKWKAVDVAEETIERPGETPLHDGTVTESGDAN